MTDSRGCEHEGAKVETASNRLNGVADPEGATPACNKLSDVTIKVNLTITLLPYTKKSCYDTPFVKLQANGVFLNPIAFSFAYTNPTTNAIGVCRNN